MGIDLSIKHKTIILEDRANHWSLGVDEEFSDMM